LYQPQVIIGIVFLVCLPQRIITYFEYSIKANDDCDGLERYTWLPVLARKLPVLCHPPKLPPLLQKTTHTGCSLSPARVSNLLKKGKKNLKHHYFVSKDACSVQILFCDFCGIFQLVFGIQNKKNVKIIDNLTRKT
jgi:hypothetical protein